MARVSRFASIILLVFLASGAAGAQPQTIEAAMEMSPQLLSAIKTDFQDPDKQWRVRSVQAEDHEQLTKVDEDLLMVAEQHATVSIQSALTGKLLIFMLKGPVGGDFESGRVIINGTAFTFTDAGLLAWFGDAITYAADTLQAEALADVFGSED